MQEQARASRPETAGDPSSGSTRTQPSDGLQPGDQGRPHPGTVPDGSLEPEDPTLTEATPGELGRTPTYDPGIPTRAGYRAPDDPVANAGTGQSGPDNVGTRPEDAHGPMLGGLADPSSPMQRLWRHEEESA